MKITEALTVEHATFRSLFEQIERACAETDLVSEIHLLAGMTERLLSQHESKEARLLWVAQTHTLEDRRQLDGMDVEHDELGRLFLEVHQEHVLTDARRLLRRALSRATRHFHYEEANVFPTLERTLLVNTLEALAEESGAGLLPFHESSPAPALKEA